MDDRLYRSVDDRMLAGVAGGVAERLDADPSIIRVVWALLIVLTGGLALVAYVVMAIVVPEAPLDQAAQGSATGEGLEGSPSDAAPPDPDAPTSGGWVAPDGQTVARAGGPPPGRRRRSGATLGDDRGPIIGGVILILLGGFFLLRQFIPAIDLGTWWPLILVAIGALLVIMSVMPNRKSG
jgi:phage shock protein C